MDFLGITLSCGMLVEWFLVKILPNSTIGPIILKRFQGYKEAFVCMRNLVFSGFTATVSLEVRQLWVYPDFTRVPLFMYLLLCLKNGWGQGLRAILKGGILDSFLDSCFYFSRLVTPGLDPFSLRSARCLAQNGLPRQPGGDPQVPRSK